MSETTIAIAEYELACGDPHAVVLLEELDEEHPLLATAKAAAARRNSLAAIGNGVLAAVTYVRWREVSAR